MKKLLMFLSLIVATTTMRAQTFYGSGVYLNADTYAVFDLSNPDLYDGFVLKVREYPSGNVVVDLGAILQSEMSDSSGTYTIPWVSPYGYDCSPSTTYSFTYLNEYYVEYYFPSTWQFYYYAHNPYTSIKIKLYLFDYDDNWLGTYNIGECQYGHTLYVGQYWHCYGLGTLAPSTTPVMRFKKSTIAYIWDYEDFYYSNDFGDYLDLIDHVKLGISFF